MSTATMEPQAIAGVAPPQSGEVTIMTVFPSLGATGAGRALGRLYEIGIGIPPLTLGHLIALLSAPLVVPLYFGKWLGEFGRGLQTVPWLRKVGFLFKPIPGVVHRYVLTNRRVVIRAGIKPRDERWVELDRFDTIDVVVAPGQAWYRAGDLIFKLGPVETFRLDGVVRPETFRQTCLKARQGYMGARKATTGR